MTQGFVGRRAELTELDALLNDIRRGGRADRGIALLLRGRRRVGKSRLVSEFVQRAGVPSMFFQAARWAAPATELALFAEAIATSTLPHAGGAADVQPGNLTAALTMLARALPDDAPSIVVIDEAPWILEGTPGAAGELQRVWDRQLAGKPVLLILLGSDLAMMEALTAPDQPFHGRATEMVLDVLSPRDVGELTGLAGFDAFDAYLLTGGLPLVAQEWEAGTTREEFLLRSLSRSTSALVVSGARVLDTEFPEASVARSVLTAIGGRGERTFTGVLNAVSGSTMSASTLTASLATLAFKRVVAHDEPLSLRAATKDRRWRIADPALRFWLAFVEPALGEVDRGRPDLALARIAAGFPAWRGRAIEPVVRDALSRLLPDPQWPGVTRVGGWWPRNNTPEIDLIGATGQPAAEVVFAGTIKWRVAGTVSTEEVTRLAEDSVRVPGVNAATPLIAVSPSARSPDKRLSHTWTAADLLLAWR